MERSNSGRTCGRRCCETCQLGFATNREALPDGGNTNHRRGDGGQALSTQRHARRHAGAWLVAIHLAVVVTRRCRVFGITAGRHFVRAHWSCRHRRGVTVCGEHARIQRGKDKPYDQKHPQHDGRVFHSQLLAYCRGKSKLSLQDAGITIPLGPRGDAMSAPAPSRRRRDCVNGSTRAEISLDAVSSFRYSLKYGKNECRLGPRRARPG